MVAPTRLRRPTLGAAAALLALSLATACTPGSSSPSASGTSVPWTAPSTTPARTATNQQPPPTPGVPAADLTDLPRVPRSCELPAAVLGHDLTGIPTTDRVVALTFTVTGNDVGLGSILATLTDTGAPATFFVSGSFAQSYADATTAIALTHPIGNATQDAIDLTTLSDAGILAEIQRGADSIRATTGRDPLPVVRAPFGAADARTTAVTNAHCRVALRWTVDSQGWRGRAAGTTATIRDRVMSGLVPGAVIALTAGSQPEDGTTLDTDALAAVIAAIRSRGYDLVTLDRLWS
jgi:peptidoglycan/xylan/chitin deacetylase (PgdA/CDA1 family)